MVFSSSPNSAFKPWKRPEFYIISKSEMVELLLDNPNLNIPFDINEFIEWIKTIKLVKNEHGKLQII